MPRKSQKWDPVTLVGNPTKSQEVNDFIRFVKKLEVRKEGAPSQVVRPLAFSEFLCSLELVQNEAYKHWKHLATAKFQW